MASAPSAAAPFHPPRSCLFKCDATSTRRTPARRSLRRLRIASLAWLTGSASAAPRRRGRGTADRAAVKRSVSASASKCTPARRSWRALGEVSVVSSSVESMSRAILRRVDPPGEPSSTLTALSGSLVPLALSPAEAGVARAAAPAEDAPLVSRPSFAACCSLICCSTNSCTRSHRSLFSRVSRASRSACAPLAVAGLSARWTAQGSETS
mmetsp:Transcript_28549/g.92180  ORF Transcript_28549/g.92180 Transcript_28549/m.92180 type:complete len:210 (-) Transcript_28549:1610-2239(-)